MLPILIGAGLGLGKGMLDQQQEAKDRQMAATIAQWSPWTGMQTPMPKRADVFGSVLQGGTTGALVGQMMPAEAAAAQVPSQDLAQQPLSGGMQTSPQIRGYQSPWFDRNLSYMQRMS